VLIDIKKTTRVVSLKQQLPTVMLKLAQQLIKDKKHFVLGLEAGQEKGGEQQEEDGAAVDILKNII
jgi:uncharacterized Ntn-hydrolase superfamily protein